MIKGLICEYYDLEQDGKLGLGSFISQTFLYVGVLLLAALVLFVVTICTYYGNKGLLMHGIDPTSGDQAVSIVVDGIFVYIIGTRIYDVLNKVTLIKCNRK